MTKWMLRCVLALALLAPCAAAGENIELRFSWWGGADRHEATLAAIKAFEAENPGVTVKGEYMGNDGYLERLTLQIGAGSEPDIIQTDWSWLTMFAKGGEGFYDMNTLRDSINLGDFNEKWLAAGLWGGKQIAIPTSWTGVVIVYNKTTWDKAGIPFPKTWDEFIAAGKTFHEKLGAEYYPLDLDWHEIVLFTHPYIFQKTGRQYIHPTEMKIDLTKEEIAEWLAHYKRLVAEGALIDLPTRTDIAGGNTVRQVHEFGQYHEGKWAGTLTFDAAMSVRVADGLSEKFTFEVGPFPTLPDAKVNGRNARSAAMFAIGKNTKNPEMAAKFINFMLDTAEGARILKSTRGVMLSNTSEKTLREEGFIPDLNLQAMVQIREEPTFMPSPYFENVRIKELQREVFESVAWGKMTPEEAADRLYDEGNRILQRLARDAN